MKLDQIVDDVLPQLPGALIASVRDAVLAAARELCTEANVWQEETDLYVPAGYTDAEVDSPSTAAEVLRVVSIGGLTAGCDYQQPLPYLVQMRSAHSEPRRLKAMVACRPKLKIGLRIPLPSSLERWCSAISYNTLYRMMRTPAAEWSNPELAEHYRQLYIDQLSDARRVSALGHQQGSRRVQQPRFT